MIRTIALVTLAVLGGDDNKGAPKDQPAVKRTLRRLSSATSCKG
jgi:hypothetical protein